MVDLLQIVIGNAIFEFDGHVLEIFDPDMRNSHPENAGRLHIRQLSAKVSKPGRTGDRNVQFLALRNSVWFSTVQQGQWDAFQSLLDALQGAGASIEVKS
jgi:hypothetical protein